MSIFWSPARVRVQPATGYGFTLAQRIRTAKDAGLIDEDDMGAAERVETALPLKFLRGGRAISSVLSKDVKLLADFRRRYGERFATVGEYFAFRQRAVALIDAAPLLPELLKVAAAQQAVEDAAAAL
jgi:hypothetical protein